MYYRYLCILLAFAGIVFADEEKSITLRQLPVTANPLNLSVDELATPIYIMNGSELQISREPSLGATLKNIPGVSNSSWGGSVGRPVIRGMDSDRIKILTNGMGNIDASSLSSDHAVAIDPIIIEQIEVVRGPATLLYGGGALGGVVNALDHRIPAEKVDGIIGRYETSFGGASKDANAATVIDFGIEDFSFHIDAYLSDSKNQKIPGYSVSKRLADSQGLARDAYGNKTLNNSDRNTDGGAFGASYIFKEGYTGFSLSSHNMEYGNPIEPGGRFDLDSDRIDWVTEFKDKNSFFSNYKIKLAHAKYSHNELDIDGSIGSSFKNRGVESKIEITHKPILNVSGVIGLDFENLSFSTPNGEPFLPKNQTLKSSIYLVEEMPLGKNRLTLGLRHTKGEISAEAFTSDDGCSVSYTTTCVTELSTDFSQTSKDFTANNIALGSIIKVSPNWSISTNLSHNERVPSHSELFAYGHHHATEIIEQGDRNLKVERSNSVDLQLKWQQGKDSFSIGPYYTRFNSFIGLLNSGETQFHEEVKGDGSEEFDVYQFKNIPAIFKGFEFSGQFRMSASILLNVSGDYVSAKNKDGDNLPRIPPMRLTSGLEYQYDKLVSRVNVARAFSQNKVDDYELKTDGYTNLSASLNYPLPLQAKINLFARADNLLDDEIRDHTSFLKDKAPMGGRSIIFGLSGSF